MNLGFRRKENAAHFGIGETILLDCFENSTKIDFLDMGSQVRKFTTGKDLLCPIFNLYLRGDIHNKYCYVLWAELNNEITHVVFYSNSLVFLENCIAVFELKSISEYDNDLQYLKDAEDEKSKADGWSNMSDAQKYVAEECLKFFFYGKWREKLGIFFEFLKSDAKIESDFSSYKEDYPNFKPVKHAFGKFLEKYN